MIEDFLKEYARLICDYPDEVSIKRLNVADGIVHIVISVFKDDIGKLIGKNGNMISALKIISSGWSVKEHVSYRVFVEST